MSNALYNLNIRPSNYRRPCRATISTLESIKKAANDDDGANQVLRRSIPSVVPRPGETPAGQDRRRESAADRGHLIAKKGLEIDRVVFARSLTQAVCAPLSALVIFQLLLDSQAENVHRSSSALVLDVALHNVL